MAPLTTTPDWLEIGSLISTSVDSNKDILKHWRMCGCCYQFNAENATNFITDCQDSEGTCEDYCTVQASGDRSNRVYNVNLGNPTQAAAAAAVEA